MLDVQYFGCAARFKPFWLKIFPQPNAFGDRRPRQRSRISGYDSFWEEGSHGFHERGLCVRSKPLAGGGSLCFIFSSLLWLVVLTASAIFSHAHEALKSFRLIYRVGRVADAPKHMIFVFNTRCFWKRTSTWQKHERCSPKGRCL